MRIIELDAAGWTKVLDVYEAILAAIGAPEWNGRSVQALMDAMIWDGMSEAKPPYTVRIAGAAKVPKEIRDEIHLPQKVLLEQRGDFGARTGRGPDVYLEFYGTPDCGQIDCPGLGGPDLRGI